MIHAGLYYPPGSLKARFCVSGREAIYQRCGELGIGHRQLGKIVVATEDAECERVEALRRNADELGAPSLELLTPRAIRKREPCVEGELALLSPRSGIVDAHALCTSWLAEAESHGAALALGAEFLGATRVPQGYRLGIRDSDGDPFEIDAAAVVNAAGLASDRVAAAFGIDVEEAGYGLHPCKGDYFSLTSPRRFAFNGLVYPVQSQAGLGIHVTLDLGGRVRFGPDTEYVEARDDYSIDPGKAIVFAEAVARYVPGFDATCLGPDYAGIRPKLAGPDTGFRDFVVEEESARGFPGLVNLIGIESPGLTAAPAIASRVAELLRSL